MVFAKLTCELHLMVFPRCLVRVIRARLMMKMKEFLCPLLLHHPLQLLVRMSMMKLKRQVLRDLYTVSFIIVLILLQVITIPTDGERAQREVATPQHLIPSQV